MPPFPSSSSDTEERKPSTVPAEAPFDVLQPLGNAVPDGRSTQGAEWRGLAPLDDQRVGYGLMLGAQAPSSSCRSVAPSSHLESTSS